MIWQDGVMTVGQFLFFVALIPTIRAKEKPALSTAVLTAGILTIYVPTLWTLHLHIAVVSTVLVTVGWWIIAYQSWVKSRRIF